MVRGKVVLVRFPFDDLSGSKVRPAVCLTDPVGPYDHVVLAFITSRINPESLDSDLVLAPGMDGFRETGLQIASTLRLHRLLTVSESVIARELGWLGADLMAQVERRLKNLFQIS